MRWSSALIITFNLFVAAAALDYYTGVPAVWVLLAGSAVWAAWDARSVQPWRYQTGLAYRPIVILMGVLLLWLVVFPWYLVVRGRIRAGTLTQKPDPSDSAS